MAEHDLTGAAAPTAATLEMACAAFDRLAFMAGSAVNLLEQSNPDLLGEAATHVVRQMGLIADAMQTALGRNALMDAGEWLQVPGLGKAVRHG